MYAWDEHGRLMAGRPVGTSPEFKRIMALPQRDHWLTVPPSGLEWLLAPPALCAAGPECPYMRGLKPCQLAALCEAALCQGLLAPMGVGSGKAAVSLLLPSVFPNVTRAALFVPAALVAQTLKVHAHLKQHWPQILPLVDVEDALLSAPPGLTVLSYHDLSSMKHADLLPDLQPGLIVFDESHSVSRSVSTRTKRVKVFARMFKDTIWCDLSGTIIDRSARDWMPAAARTLGERSPAPRDHSTIDHWAFALDDGTFKCPPGVLSAFRDASKPDEPLREAYRRRVVSTPGVVATALVDCDASLIISPRRPRVPKVIKDALTVLRQSWERPDGGRYESGVDVARCAKQLAHGFYQRWTKDAPVEWLEARKDWHAEMTQALKRARPGIDSPGLLEEAARDGTRPSDAYNAWARVAPFFKPVTEAVWLSDFMLEACVTWQEKLAHGIVWTAHPDFGQRLSAHTGWRYYGDGPEDANDILAFEGVREPEVTIIASIASHGTGRNLQAFGRNFAVSVPSSGKVWEQLIGRTHRSGQGRDEVYFEVAQHTPELIAAFDSAKANARIIAEQWPQPQRLLLATYIDAPPDSCRPKPKG